MSTHWRAPEADDRAEPFGAPRATDHRSTSAPAGGGDLVVAPMPMLPTRWDALDEGARTGGAHPVGRGRGHDSGHDSGQGLALRNAAYDTSVFDDAAFTAPAVVPGEYPAPLPVVATIAPLGVAPTSLFDDVYKAVFRLTGVRMIAIAIAREAMAAAVTPATPLGDPLTAMTVAVAQSLACALPDEPRIPYFQHRARLRRDLARRGDPDRAILAMRHLVSVPPSGVAARLNLPESQVREVASAWCPDDSRVDSLALLRGIDSWISSDLGSAPTAVGGSELAHLDDDGD